MGDRVAAQCALRRRRGLLDRNREKVPPQRRARSHERRGDSPESPHTYTASRAVYTLALREAQTRLHYKDKSRPDFRRSGTLRFKGRCSSVAGAKPGERKTARQARAPMPKGAGDGEHSVANQLMLASPPRRVACAPPAPPRDGTSPSCPIKPTREVAGARTAPCAHRFPGDKIPACTRRSRTYAFAPSCACSPRHKGAPCIPT